MKPKVHVTVVSTIFALILAVNPIASMVVSASDTSVCPNGTSLNIVAHADDDLIFMNPDIQRDIDNNLCVRTVVVTAGDAGLGLPYAEGREAGSRAAYAAMAGVADEWTVTDNTVVNGHTLWLYTLDARPNISVMYMRINDGNIDGSGFAATEYASLKKLWAGQISAIGSIDTIAEYRQSYTKQDLITTLADFIMLYAPDTVRSMDFLANLTNTPDHTDHVALAYFTQRAERESPNADYTAAYQGYSTSSLAANTSGTTLDRKWNALLAYTQHDPYMCQTRTICSSTDSPYGGWMARQYTRGLRNIASLATVTASTENAASGQTAKKAIDGYALGYPIDSSKEWATTGGKAGSWVNLAWKARQTIEKIVLYDRPNTDDQILSGTLTFSDGSTVAVGKLFNTGTPTVITFTPRVATSVKFTVKTVSATTGNVGLAEFQVISTNVAGEATVTASSQNTASGQTAAKAIDGYALGYPTDSSKEWATAGGKAGSWITLAWVAPRLVNKIVLFDRPNTSDRIMSGSLKFSDGSVVKVGALPDDGKALIVTLPSYKSIQSVQFKVDSVSPTTTNVGLAEMQVHDGE